MRKKPFKKWFFEERPEEWPDGSIKWIFLDVSSNELSENITKRGAQRCAKKVMARKLLRRKIFLAKMVRIPRLIN